MKTETSVSAAHRPVYLQVFHILALASLIIYILTVGATLLKLITLGAFLAMLLTPMADWFERKRLGHFAGALFPVLVTLIVLVLLTSLAIRQISSIASSLEGAADRVTHIVERLNYFLNWHLNLEKPLLGDLDSEGVVNLVKEYSGKLLSMMGGFTGSLFSALVIPAMTFFILYYRNHLFEFSARILRDVPRESVEKRVEEARLVAHDYFVGMMKVVGILAILNSGALLLIGVENAIFFGVFAAMLNIVPFFGPLFGATLPILFVLVMRDSLYYPLGVAAAFVVVQLIEGNLLTPRIIGRNVRINPLVVFIGLLAGSMIWGVVGMIIIIPVISISMQLFRLSPRTEPFAYLLGTPPRKDKRRGRRGDLQ